uniref:Uncharacterized protein n=1 Tax=Candidatus Kentrum sp. DK TaxID=2126562 RepID=A0A450SVS3_9GAMM|nr:MAG: hypothetical protein BECKDK2373C_GA0170839_10628 [Candidatus Kentron sp. DK]VFJ58132.1 MAG: hypothetical protein BECKDK2373B_GA0170837_10716 [Candidatus Kentron sp. DK]
MSGPKDIILERAMTREEFKRLAERIGSAVKGKNYQVKTTTKTDEKHVTVTAEHWHSGDKIIVTAGLDTRNIQLDIQDEYTCREIQRQIAEALGGEAVKRTTGGASATGKIAEAGAAKQGVTHTAKTSG